MSAYGWTVLVSTLLLWRSAKGRGDAEFMAMELRDFSSQSNVLRSDGPEYWFAFGVACGGFVGVPVCALLDPHDAATLISLVVGGVATFISYLTIDEAVRPRWLLLLLVICFGSLLGWMLGWVSTPSEPGFGISATGLAMFLAVGWGVLLPWRGSTRGGGRP